MLWVAMERHKSLDWQNSKCVGSTVQPAPALAAAQPHLHTLTLGPGSLNMSTTPTSQDPRGLTHSYMSVAQSWSDTRVPRPCSPLVAYTSRRNSLLYLPSCLNRNLERL